MPIKYYQLELRPYMEINAYIESLLTIQKLVYWQLIANMKKFKLISFMSLIFNSEASICPGFGYEYDSVNFAWSTMVKLPDCYK